MRILLFNWSFFCPDVAESLRRLGCEVREVPRLQPALPARARAALAEFQPDLLFSMNFNPLLAELGHQAGVPYTAWNFDVLMNSAFCAPAHAYPNCHIFCIEPVSLEIYARAGYKYARYLPIACNIQRLDRVIAAGPERGTARHADMVFVGGSMADDGRQFDDLLANLDLQARQEPDPRGRQILTRMRSGLDAVYTAECADFFHPAVRARLDAASQALGFDLARAVSSDPEFFHVVIGKKVSAAKRLACVRAAAEAVPVHVYGDEGWRGATSSQIQWHGAADYLSATPLIYHHARLTLHIEKTYNIGLINLRTLEAMACGSLALVEPNAAMRAAFAEGQAAVYFDSLPDLARKAQYYLAHPAERDAIAARAQKQVRTEFDLDQRLTELLALCLG